MAETLGTLSDKLTIIKLKQWHSEDAERQKSLKLQEQQLISEINEFIVNAVNGAIPLEKLTFSSNKVFRKEGNEISAIKGEIGFLFAQLAHTNCELWHEQEKVYEFEKIPVDQKDIVVKRLAILNLERNRCMDEIDQQFKRQLEARGNA
jgi:hypothetical protein